MVRTLGRVSFHEQLQPVVDLTDLDVAQIAADARGQVLNDKLADLGFWRESSPLLHESVRLFL